MFDTSLLEAQEAKIPDDDQPHDSQIDRSKRAVNVDRLPCGCKSGGGKGMAHTSAKSVRFHIKPNLQSIET